MRLLDNNADLVVSRDTLFRRQFGNVTVYIPDIPEPITKLLTGRCIVGWERRKQYKRALEIALASFWKRYIVPTEGLHGTIPIASLLRGGEYVRPENLSGVMGLHVPHVGLRVERFQDAEGLWYAEVDRTASFDLHLLCGAKENGALDECAAKGKSVRKAAMEIKAENPEMEKFVCICPIFSDAALRELMELPFPVILFTFGVFKVMPKGWEKPYTDIVVTAPDGPESDDTYIMIPDSVWKHCWEKYGALDGYRGVCVVGDASDNLSDDKRVQVRYLIKFGHETVVWNRVLPPRELWMGLHDLVRRVPFHSSAQAIAWQAEMARIAAEGIASGINDREVCKNHLNDLEGLWRQITAQNGK